MVRKVLRELVQQGNTIVLSSHELWEVEKLSTCLGIIDKGKLIGADTIEALREAGSGGKNLNSSKRRQVGG